MISGKNSIKINRIRNTILVMFCLLALSVIAIPLNVQPAGKYENGITPLGHYITQFVRFGGQANLLAVKVDNHPDYKEEDTGTPFLRNSKDFNPNFGGLNRDARLIVSGKIYQTLPLYNNLKTSGVYVYQENIDLRSKSAEVKVEAEVVNETGNYASITLLAFVMDNDSVVLAKLDGNTSDLIAGQTEIFTASRKGLKSAGLKIESNAVEVADGLIPAMPRTMPGLKIN